MHQDENIPVIPINRKPGFWNFVLSFSQILASVAVIVSIILLITEYRRSGVLQEKDVENLVYQRVMEMNRMVVEEYEVAALLEAAEQSLDSLSPVDVRRYLAFEHIFYDSWETLWTGYQDGLVDEETWSGWNDWFVQESLRKPPLALEGNKRHYSGAFLEYLSTIQPEP